MHVECNSCNTRYTIADEKIPPQGARVRCRKCQAVFQVPGPSSPSPLPLIPPTPEDTSPALGHTPAEPAPSTMPPPPPPAARVPSMTPPPPPPAAEPAPSMPSPVAPARNPFAPPAAAPGNAGPPDFEHFTPAFAAGAQAVADAKPAPPAPAAPPPRPATPSPFEETAAPVTAPPQAPSAPAPAPASPRTVSSYAPSAGIPEGLPEAERLKHERARRFARVLASDIAIYNKEKKERGVKDGNLVAVLGYEIKKSWEVYKERVTPELANSTPYFRDALNEMLAEGKKVF